MGLVKSMGAAVLLAAVALVFATMMLPASQPASVMAHEDPAGCANEPARSGAALQVYFDNNNDGVPDGPVGNQPVVAGDRLLYEAGVNIGAQLPASCTAFGIHVWLKLPGAASYVKVCTVPVLTAGDEIFCTEAGATPEAGFPTGYVPYTVNLAHINAQGRLPADTRSRGDVHDQPTDCTLTDAQKNANNPDPGACFRAATSRSLAYANPLLGISKACTSGQVNQGQNATFNVVLTNNSASSSGVRVEINSISVTDSLAGTLSPPGPFTLNQSGASTTPVFTHTTTAAGTLENTASASAAGVTLYNASNGVLRTLPGVNAGPVNSNPDCVVVASTSTPTNTPTRTNTPTSTATSTPAIATNTPTATSTPGDLDGIAKDLDEGGAVNPLDNVWLCKTNDGAPTIACGQATFVELIQMADDIDTCNDDDDGDGRGCRAIWNGVQWVSASSDWDGDFGDLDFDGPCATPTTATCTPDPDGEFGEGLGAFEVQIKFDHKLFLHPVLDPDETVLDDTGRVPNCTHDVITENWVLFGCTTKGVPNPGAVDTCTAPNAFPGACGSTTHEGPSVANPSVLVVVTFSTQPDLLERLRPTKDNGVRADLLDENCEAADVFGSPYNMGVEDIGSNEAPSGGLTDDCRDATLTIRMLEGDIDLDCDVDVVDDQLIAFRYGAVFGLLIYDPFFDVEPNSTPPDFDIDIKDLQFVFGRNGSTCEAPIPPQDPQPPIPDP